MSFLHHIHFESSIVIKSHLCNSLHPYEQLLVIYFIHGQYFIHNISWLMYTQNFVPCMLSTFSLTTCPFHILFSLPISQSLFPSSLFYFLLTFLLPSPTLASSIQSSPSHPPTLVPLLFFLLSLLQSFSFPSPSAFQTNRCSHVCFPKLPTTERSPQVPTFCNCEIVTMGH